MRKLMLTIPGALLLSACGPSAQEQAAANAAAVANQQQASEMAAKVEALAPGQREGVFIRAIRDAGLPCQGVTGAERGAVRDFVRKLAVKVSSLDNPVSSLSGRCSTRRRRPSSRARPGDPA